jgi:hypothetical protein
MDIMQLSPKPTAQTFSLAQIELLKIMALVTMIIDHIGYVFFPDGWFFALRLIGRVSMPLFLLVIALRLAEKPARVDGYLQRLLLWGVISQYPYWFFSTGGEGQMWAQLNMLLTFALGVLLFKACIQAAPNKNYRVLWAVVAIAAAATGWFAVYGVAAVLAIPCLVWVLRRSLFWGIIMCAGFAALANLPLDMGVPWMLTDYSLALCAAGVALVALGIKYVPIQSCPRLPQWSFYAFYPAHISVLLALYLWLNS